MTCVSSLPVMSRCASVLQATVLTQPEWPSSSPARDNRWMKVLDAATVCVTRHPDSSRIRSCVTWPQYDEAFGVNRALRLVEGAAAVGGGVVAVEVEAAAVVVALVALVAVAVVVESGGKALVGRPQRRTVC